MGHGAFGSEVSHSHSMQHQVLGQPHTKEKTMLPPSCRVMCGSFPSINHEARATKTWYPEGPAPAPVKGGMATPSLQRAPMPAMVSVEPMEIEGLFYIMSPKS
jgi:hypothetical protein